MAKYQRTRFRQNYDEIRSFIESETTPFGNTSQTNKKKRQHRALTDLEYFARTYFPHHLTEGLSVMHHELYAKFQLDGLCCTSSAHYCSV